MSGSANLAEVVRMYSAEHSLRGQSGISTLRSADEVRLGAAHKGLLGKTQAGVRLDDGWYQAGAPDMKSAKQFPTGGPPPPTRDTT